MIAVDSNLVYVHRKDAPRHDSAYARMVELADGIQAVARTSLIPVTGLVFPEATTFVLKQAFRSKNWLYNQCMICQPCAQLSWNLPDTWVVRLFENWEVTASANLFKPQSSLNIMPG